MPYKKYKDTVPQLTLYETKYLQKQSVGRNIIIYEDVVYQDIVS